MGTFTNSPEAIRGNPVVCIFALSGCQCLAVTNDAIMDASFSVRRPCAETSSSTKEQQGNMTRCCDDRSCERTSACFVDADYDGGM